MKVFPAVNVTVPFPALVKVPVPEITSDIVNAPVRSTMSAALLVIAPESEPVAPPAPICNAPSLINVPAPGVFAPVKVTVPLPDFSSEPVPLTAPV